MKLLFLSLTIFLFSIKLNAQWVQTNGPEGGLIANIATDGVNVFTSTPGHIYKSTNNGGSWTKVYESYTINFSGLAVNNSIVVAAVNSSTLLISTDYGNTWTQRNNGVSIKCRAMLVHGNSIYSATTDGKIFLTHNNGITWSDVTNNLPNVMCLSLVANDTSIFVGTSAGIYVSSNSGSTWTQSYAGMPFVSVQALLVENGVIYAGTSSGMYYSINNGYTWNARNVGMENISVTALVKIGTNFFASTYDGVYRSLDNGHTWGISNNNLRYTDIRSMVSASTSLLLGTLGTGIWASNNYGTSWSSSNNGIIALHAINYAFKGTEMYVATAYGLFFSTDRGQNWIEKIITPTLKNISSVALCGDNIIVGTYSNGIFRSVDNGNTWTSHLGVLWIQALASIGPNVIAATRDGVYLSQDSGITWNSSFGSYYNAEKLVVEDSRIFASLYDDGVYRSTNGGVTWSKIVHAQYEIFSVCADSTNIYIGSYANEIMKSSDNGLTWDSVMIPGTIGYRVKDLEVEGNNLFASIDGLGIYWSTDQGVTWTAINAGLPSSSPFEVAINGSDVYTSPSSSGVYINSSSLIGIDDKTLSPFSLRIYPNPTNSSFSIAGKFNHKSTRLEIFNLIGERLHCEEFSSTFAQQTKHITPNLSSGIYFVRVSDGVNHESKKLIIEN